MAVTLGRAGVGTSSSAPSTPARGSTGARSTWPWRCAGSRSRWPPTPSSRDGALLTTFVSGVFVLSFAHQPLTLALVYGDREQFALRRAVFGVSPFVFVLAVVPVLHVSVLRCSPIVAGLWNAEHTLMQRYGITRIYGRKAGQQQGGLERALLFSWLARGARADRVRSRPRRPGSRLLDLGGTNAMAVRDPHPVPLTAGLLLVPVVVVATVVAAASVASERRRRRRRQPGQVALPRVDRRAVRRDPRRPDRRPHGLRRRPRRSSTS